MRTIHVLKIAIAAFLILGFSQNRAHSQSRLVENLVVLGQAALQGPQLIERAKNSPDLRDSLFNNSYCVTSQEAESALSTRGFKTVRIDAAEIVSALRNKECDVYMADENIKDFIALFPTAGDDVSVDPEPVDPPVVTDNSPPKIIPLEKQYTANLGKADVTIRVEDQSPIKQVIVGKTKMNPVGRSMYNAKVSLPRNYKPEKRTVQAVDALNNASKNEIFVRRTPFCGPEKGLDVESIAKIQNDLRKLRFLDGQVDGLLGPNTCAAIEQFLGQKPTNWTTLQYLIDVRFIKIDAPRSVVIAPDQSSIAVTITDPRGTGAPVRLVMIPTNQNPTAKEIGNFTQNFPIDWAPQPNERVRFEARSDKGLILATAETLLTTLKPEITVSSVDLTGDNLSSAEPTVDLRVQLKNVPEGTQIVAKGDSNGTTENHFGGPTIVSVSMPKIGKSEALTVFAQYKGNTLAERKIKLDRPVASLVLPDGSSYETENQKIYIDLNVVGKVARDSQIVAKNSSGIEVWSTTARSDGSFTSELSMPEAGTESSISFDLKVGDQLIDTVSVKLISPNQKTKDWFWKIATACALLIAGGAVFLPKKPVDPIEGGGNKIGATPTLEVVTVKDEAPHIDLLPAALPSVLIETIPDAEPDISIEFENEEGSST